MGTFITSIFKDKVEFAGPQIKAENWEDAEKQAKELGVSLIGSL